MKHCNAFYKIFNLRNQTPILQSSSEASLASLDPKSDSERPSTFNYYANVSVSDVTTKHIVQSHYCKMHQSHLCPCSERKLSEEE